MTAGRTPFFEFQARNRRATWRLTAVCALVAGGGGVLAAFGFVANLVLVLFALVFIPSVTLVALGFLASLSPAASGFREPLWDAGLFLLGGLGLLARLWPEERPGMPVVLALGLGVGSWLAVRAVWLDAGVGRTLLGMGARAPRPGDLEEQQLGNVVHEMAIAAGITPPAVRLLDAPVANAAAVGRGLADSYVVVSRRLLEGFDRAETQAVLGHLVASIGNGDLRGAAQVHSMLYLLELVVVIVLAPFARLPGRVARAWLAATLARPFEDAARRGERAHTLIALLRQHRDTLGRTDGERLGREYFGPVGSVLVRVCPPLLALVALTQAATQFLLLFVSLPVGLLWRSRRYLADATAVELTRNPTALHRALVRLAATGAAVPGGEAVSHLFIVAPEAMGGGSDRPRGTLAEREGLLMGLHPPLARRLARLVRMGAVPALGPAPPAH